MNEEAKFEVWGLSLSLKPPIITNLDHKPICKRESQFSIDEKNPQMNKLNNTLAMIPRINKGLVLKQPVEIIDLEEEDEKTGKVGSPKSTLSSVTGKRFGGDREMISDDEEGGNRGGGESSGVERKKLRLCKEQVLVLEQAFSEHTTLNTKQKVALATQVNLRPRQVEVWFQNRRARTKFKQTELDCEQLKKYCETLTEENKRLQKEVHELRALKFSPENSMMDANHPPTTLTMCPSCKNVLFSSSSATTGTPAVETGRSLMGVFHQHTPLSIQKLSFTINNNQVIESSKP